MSTNSASFTTNSGEITVAGALTAKGGVTLAAAGALTVNASIDATGATVSLTGKSVTQTAAGSITASALAAVATGVDVDLTLATNAVTTFAAKASGSISFFESDGFAIGSVAGIDGITADATGGIVRLQAGGSINQTKSILAAELSVVTTAGDIDLTGATNKVGVFAAKVGSGNIGFDEADGFVIGSVSGPSEAVDGLTAGGDIRLKAGGTITQSKAVSAGGALGVTTTAGEIDLTIVTNEVAVFAASSAGFVGLLERDGFSVGSAGVVGNLTALNGVNAVGAVSFKADGAITQTHAITAASLAAVTTTGNIDLGSGVTNAAAKVGFKSAGDVSYKTSTSINVDEVGTVGSLDGVAGIATTAKTTLITTGATTGISQTKAITTATLAVGSAGSGDVTLTNGGNQIDTITSAAGGLGTGITQISDGTGGLNVGPITGSGPITITTKGGALTVVGAVNIANDNISLVSLDDAVTVNATVSAGSGTVALKAGGASSFIAATNGAITTAVLTLETGSDGGAIVTTVAHNVGTVQTVGAGLGKGGLTFEQSRTGGTQVGSIVTTGGGTVSITEGKGTLAVTGTIDTSAGDGAVSLVAGSGALSLSGQIKAGTARVTLSANSTIFQSATAGISAGELSALTTTGAISLIADTNAVGTFAAQSGGNVSYTSKNTFNIGTVGSIAGVRTSAGKAVSLEVVASGGTITQSNDAAGAIVTGTINIATTNGSVAIDNAANAISAIGIVTLGTGSFTFVNSVGTSLNVGGNVSAQGGIQITNSGNLTTTANIVSDGDIALTSVNGQVSLGGEVTSNLGSIELHSKNTLDTGASAIAAKAGSVTLISDAGTVTIGSGGVAVGNTLTIQIAAGQTLSVTGAIIAPQIALIADDMVITAAVGDATTTSITLAPVSDGRGIVLGGVGVVANTLTLIGDALSHLGPNAALTIGSSKAGAISVRGATIVNSQLDLLTGAGITQTGILSVGGGTGTLNIAAGGTVALDDSGVQIGSIGGGTTAGSFSILRTGGAAATLTVQAITTDNGDIAIRNLDGDLVITGAQSSKGGNIALGSDDSVGSKLILNAAVDAGAGTVVLVGRGGITQNGGVVTATGLLARNFSSGDIDLTATNAVSGNVSLINLPGDVSFTSTEGFIVGGISSKTVAGNSFVLGSGIRTAGTGTANLHVGGDVTQANGSGDIVSTGTLRVTRLAGTNPNVTFDNGNNSVTSIAAVSIGQGAFTLSNSGNLSINGTIAASGGISLATTGSGTISVGADLNAGPTGAVALSAAGNISQSGGVIAAASVDARALGSVFLDAGANTFSVITGSGAAGFSAITAQTLTIGTGGVQSTSGSVTLRSLGGGIVVADTITAATTVSLFANGGDIVDLATGGIVAAGLQAVAAGSVDLSNAAASNKVSTIAGSASGNFMYVDGNAVSLTVGTVGPAGITSTTGNITVKATAGALSVNSAITAANGSVTLQSNGALGVAAKVAASTSSGRVSLTSTVGSVVENVGGAIVAAELLALAALNVDIAQSTNVVGAKGFAAQATNGFVVFRNSGAVELDQVAGVNGVTAGGAVFISTTSGNISQTATGVIKAGNGLGLEAQNGSVILDQANEVIGNVAVANTKNGSVTIRTVGDLNIGAVDAINTAGVDVPLLNGIAASTAAGKFVSLVSDTGAITQSLGAKDSIIGGELRIATNNRNATLANTGNQLVAVGNVALGDGKLTLFDSAGGLDVNGAVQANGGVSLTTQGGVMSVLGSVTAANGDISLINKGGALVTQGDIIAGDGDISLTAQGALTVQAVITTAKGDISLTAEAGALAIQGSVTTSDGSVSLTSLTSGINLNGDLSASNQLQLMGKGGTIVQTAGTIVAQSLVLLHRDYDSLAGSG